MDIWKELLRQAYVAATKSPDPSTQNGALIVWRSGDAYEILGSDYNRFPAGIAYTHERLHTPLKYLYIGHAEWNSVFGVLHERTLRDIASPGLTMVCPWAACTGCAKTIIASGIHRLVRHKQAHLQSARNIKWQEEIVVADVMLREVGVEIVDYDGKIGAPAVLHSGKYWNP